MRALKFPASVRPYMALPGMTVFPKMDSVKAYQQIPVVPDGVE